MIDDQWRKSTFSNQGECVEARRASKEEVTVRDSKDPEGPRVSLTGDAWKAFLESL